MYCRQTWQSTYSFYKSASWCSYFSTLLIRLLQLNHNKISLFWDHTATTNDRFTPQHRLATWHRKQILFTIFRLVHSAFVQLICCVALLTLLSLLVKTRQTAKSCWQAIYMMPFNHGQSRVCHVTVLADAGTSASNGTLTAVDLTATGIIVNKHFLNVTYSPFSSIYTKVNFPQYRFIT